MADFLHIIKRPITDDFNRFDQSFDRLLTTETGLLGMVMQHVRMRAGKRMRPILTLLMARALGQERVGEDVIHAASALELLHTASLVHDDVVDESSERRGQLSVNAQFNNKTAVLSGDYILSTSLREIAATGSTRMVDVVAKLGQTLSHGELNQLASIADKEICEDTYFDVIDKKTASLFSACCEVAALSNGVGESDLKSACEFGRNIGLIFQIRDDIFDYYDSAEVGKPTGNDMREGKVTLPLIYALKKAGTEEFAQLVYKVKQLHATDDDIAQLRSLTKEYGGLDYAQRRMDDLREKCLEYIHTNISSGDIYDALAAYVDYVIGREK